MQHRIAPAPHAAPQAAQRDRDHRHRPPRQDLLHPRPERRDLAIAAQPAFGKDAYHFAGGQRFVDRVVCPLQYRGILLVARDRNRLGGTEHEAQQRDVEDPVIHHEAHRPTQVRHQQQRVHEADVVAHQQRRTFLGNLRGAIDAHPVQRIHQHPGDEAHHELGHQGEDVPGHQHVEQRRGEEDLRRIHAQRAQPQAETGRRHDQQRVQDVGAGDDPRQLLARRARLHEREQRHHVEAGEHADQGEVERNTPTARAAQEGQPVQPAHGRHAVPREVQIHAEGGQPERAQRHQADLHPPARHLLAQQRADAGADREQGEHQCVHRTVAAQRLARVDRQLRDQHRAEEPEPRDTQHRVEHRAIGAGDRQHPRGLAERVPVELQLRCSRRRRRNAPTCQIAGHRHRDRRAGRQQRPHASHQHQRVAGDHADQHRHLRARLDQPVAADQLVRLQRLRQDRVLDRSEHGGMHSHHEQHDQQQRCVMRVEAVRGQQHRADLEQLHVADDPALLVLLGQLAGSGGEQEERDDEQRRRQVGVERHGVVVQPHLERHQHHQRVAERIVVERPQRLGPEERRKAPLAQQCELAHAMPLVCRPRRGP